MLALINLDVGTPDRNNRNRYYKTDQEEMRYPST